jgi:hypothetical protein
MSASRWQFSTRSLLVLTAILSIVLAFAVKLPIAFRVALILAAPILLLIAILSVANFATSDRRPRLSIFSWLLLGMFFGLYAIAIARMVLIVGGRNAERWTYVTLGIAAACCLICAYRVWRSYQLIRRLKTEQTERDRAATLIAKDAH